jgi:predicted metal-binding membrane protein
VVNKVELIFTFLAVWEVMVVAMMLPSSLRFLSLFQALTSGGHRPLVRRAELCAGYALVWAGVGCVAIMVSETLYRSELISRWLEGHTGMLAGGVLLLAGGFQFTALKRRCLSICGDPVRFLMRHYRHGIGSSASLGVQYGLLCLGCCWAMMMVMVVLGGDSVYLMVLLTAITFAERALGWSNRFTGIIGLGCSVLGVLVAVDPSVLPMLTRNAGAWVAMASTPLPHHGWFWCHV